VALVDAAELNEGSYGRSFLMSESTTAAS